MFGLGRLAKIGGGLARGNPFGSAMGGIAGAPMGGGSGQGIGGLMSRIRTQPQGLPQNGLLGQIGAMRQQPAPQPAPQQGGLGALIARIRAGGSLR